MNAFWLYKIVKGIWKVVTRGGKRGEGKSAGKKEGNGDAGDKAVKV